MADLVIVESPAKARTIGKILGSGYRVKPSMGHVRDLPEQNLGVEIQNGFRPHYVVIPARRRVLSDLLKAARSAEHIYLAPDPDREGEAIAWHLQEELGKSVPRDRFYRVSYNEITASAIKEAFRHPGPIDMRRVESQQARRVLDRLVGYMVSPLLWRRVKGAASAGRVQSVALRLVCEREREIRGFVSRKYWLVFAELEREDRQGPPFEARLSRIGDRKAELDSRDTAEAVAAECLRRSFSVVKVNRREVRRRPPPPFITSTLQQAASRYFGFTPARTMRIAQRLYEGVDIGEGPVGLITYMRTDSVRVADEARQACRRLIADRFGPEFVPARPNVYRSRPGAQEAHEAIRPTDVTRHPDELKGRLKEEDWKLYNLVWRRFVASQMAPARVEQIQVDLAARRTEEVAEGDTSDRIAEHLRADYLFHVVSSRTVFPGFTAVMDEKQIRGGDSSGANGPAGEKEDREEEEHVVAALPPLAEGDPLRCRRTRTEEKETRPPPRYTEATLIRALEQNGVGRPSTYAQIISTLYQRKYVVKEKRALKPTRLGEQVNEFLVTHLPQLFDVGFTARMEEQLDEIERGRAERLDMLNSFYRNLRSWLEQARGPSADRNQVGRLLELLEQVKDWKKAPGTTRSREQRFVNSIRRQYSQKPDGISETQFKVLASIAAGYADQVPEIEEFLREQGLADLLERRETDRSQLEDAEARLAAEKLRALAGVKFEPPRRVGRRTFDDRRFVESLQRQVQGGRPLSANQTRYLDRLLLKYADQLGGPEELARRFGLQPPPRADDREVERLLESLGSVTEWDPPRKVRGREWDDRRFFESVRQQYGNGRQLSPRQVAILKRLASKYGVLPQSEGGDGGG